MTTPSKPDTELLTEHFGYPPVSLLDDIINSINILAERALNSVEQGLLNAPAEHIGFKAKSSKSKQNAKTASSQPSMEEAARHEIENGTHQLETLLCASIDRNFDKFELYVMRNILCVKPEDRDWIRLGHYEGLNFDNLKSPDNPSVDSVTRLRRRLQASQKLNCMLHAEKARNEALLGELRGLVGGKVKAGERSSLSGPLVKEDPDTTESTHTFGFLQKKGDLADGDAETPFTTTTAFTLSQLQALRALSTSLRNMMPDLKGGATDAETVDDGKKGWRRERLEYVEGATRKHLENVRGLELGENGEVRDGEWQGEGRKLAKGEVEGLEKVVALLGKSGSKGDEMDETE